MGSQVYKSLRFDGADEALWRDGIRPGWHAFKRSKTRAVCERAIALDRANRAAEAVLEMHEFRQIAGDRWMTKYTAEISGHSWRQGPVAEFDTVREARQWAESYGTTADSCTIRDAKGGRAMSGWDAYWAAQQADIATRRAQDRRRYAEAAYALLARSMDGTAADGEWCLELAAQRLEQWGDPGLAGQVRALCEGWYPVDSEIRGMMARVEEMLR